GEHLVPRAGGVHPDRWRPAPPDRRRAVASRRGARLGRRHGCVSTEPRESRGGGRSGTMKRFLLLALVAAAAGCQRSATETTSPQQPSARTEVVLWPAAQADGQIETKPAAAVTDFDSYRVSGHIALADNHTWRVGIRTDGVVVALNAGLGDYVRKGDVLA